jgi:hypothetical protein
MVCAASPAWRDVAGRARILTNAPLILTAELPPDLANWATGLRRAHFPPERNFLDAHVTLFHALPPSSEAELRDTCAALARKSGPVPARMEGVMKLGKGTALRIESPAMLALRDEIADRFHGMLTPQDEHRPRLHITIQNKVSIEAAKLLQNELAASLDPRAFTFRGLELYAYRGGPWEPVRQWSFRG